MKILNLILLVFYVWTTNLYSQNTRLKNFNTIGWYNYFGTFKINNKFLLNTEYQFRRNNLITDWQQSLFRFGVSYNLSSKLHFRLGYAFIETFPYGEIPINSYGKKFKEHRFYEMITLYDNGSFVDVSHRFLLEQRFVGRYSNYNLEKEDEYPLLHRLRYMCRLQIPLTNKNKQKLAPYFVIYDELHIGFGKNVNENIFDQNRLGILLGYRLNDVIKIEAGYINQLLQLGRELNNRNVFQYNSGLIININFSFNLLRTQNNQIK